MRPSALSLQKQQKQAQDSCPTTGEQNNLKIL